MAEPGGLPPLKAEYFAREDESDDALFYAEPRLVTHIDDGAIRALEAFYGDLLPHGGRILDLMSSWVSHLPAELAPAFVAGLGMNRVELEQNPVLDERVVQDLNREPVLPWPDAHFDAAVCTVSVQYLVRPVEVFAEVRRVLVPGGVFAVAYSNRCFPTKAVAAWRALDDRDHAALIALYFAHAGGFEEPVAYQVRPGGPGSDPLYCVVARRGAAAGMM
ncbi:MAG: methyltransferase domain-containing protein [Tepidiforma sp.]